MTRFPIRRPVASRRMAVGVVGALALIGATAGCGDEGENAEPQVIPYNAATETTTTEAPAESPEEPTAPEADAAALAEAEGRGAPELPDDELAEVTELKVVDLAEGTGAEVTADSTVIAHYRGWSVKSDGKEFDSSWGRGEPATFPLNGVIAGWTEGLQGMKVGGRRLLVIPPDKGYGSTPRGDVIQADDTLIFVVDIVGVL